MVRDLLWDEWEVRLDSVKVIRVDCPHWCVHIPGELSVVPIRYRSVNKKGAKARLWRLLGETFKKPRWVRRGQDEVMLELSGWPETEDIQLQQYLAEDPWGARYRWYMGYGPKSKCLALRDWKGATDFVQSGGERD